MGEAERPRPCLLSSASPSPSPLLHPSLLLSEPPAGLDCLSLALHPACNSRLRAHLCSISPAVATPGASFCPLRTGSGAPPGPDLHPNKHPLQTESGLEPLTPLPCSTSSRGAPTSPLLLHLHPSLQLPAASDHLWIPAPIFAWHACPSPPTQSPVGSHGSGPQRLGLERPGLP